jgi:hypothetical protein
LGFYSCWAELFKPARFYRPFKAAYKKRAQCDRFKLKSFTQIGPVELGRTKQGLDWKQARLLATCTHDRHFLSKQMFSYNQLNSLRQANFAVSSVSDQPLSMRCAGMEQASLTAPRTGTRSQRRPRYLNPFEGRAKLI